MILSCVEAERLATLNYHQAAKRFIYCTMNSISSPATAPQKVACGRKKLLAGFKLLPKPSLCFIIRAL
jgi:hypothetical protein